MTSRRPLQLLGVIGLIMGFVVQIPTQATAAQATAAQATAEKATTHQAATHQAAAICTSTPFRSSPAKRQWFRLPSVVETTTGTLVAFAERRDSVSEGIGDFDVVSTRSTDHGCTWRPYQVIGDDGGNRVSNAVPVVDASNGAVLVLSTVLPAHGSSRTYLQTSHDDGQTFSPLLDHQVKPAGFKGGLTGPGHGIQLSVTHPGRLVVPMGYRTKDGQFGASCIYSDDHGVTWHPGYDHLDPARSIEFVEGSIAELADGRLFISYRNGSASAKPGNSRYAAMSADGGDSLSVPFHEQAVNILSIQASTLALTNGPLLFSAPSSISRRNNVAIYVSDDDGVTWPTRYQVDLEDTPGAYSDLLRLDDQSIGLVYETGSQTPKERIAFRSIPIADLTDPTQVSSSLTYYRSAHPTLTSSNAKVKVTVRVEGVRSPPGRVTLRYARAGTARRATVDLAKFHEGSRVITLPKLHKGNYQLTLIYSGTARIKKVTRSAGTLQVIKR